ncbi:MAG: glycosyltransferase family 39 protein [Elusimicrobiota bacterium]|nr:glycosyltransferase family 39 protein [Elusimicrobiota bacterium]
MKKNKLIWLILLLALTLRLIGIKWGLPGDKHFYPYYSDEYNPIYVLGNMNPEKFDFNPKYLHNPTFFYYMIGATWAGGHILGLLNLTRDKDYYLKNPTEYGKLYLCGRLLVVAFALATIFIVFLLGKKLYSVNLVRSNPPPQVVGDATTFSRTSHGVNVGLISAFLLSIVPLHVFQSHFMEIAVVVSFFLTLTMYLAINAFETKKTVFFIFSGIATGLAMGTKYTVWPFLIVFMVCHFLYERKIDKKLLLYFVFSILTFLITTPYAVLDFNRFQENFFSKIPIGSMNPLLPLTLLWYSLTPPILILALFGFFHSIIKNKQDILPLLVWCFVYYLSTAAKGLYIARYQCEYLPFLCIFASSIFSLNFRNLLKLLLFGACFFLTILPTSSYLKLFLSKPPQDQASQWIIENVPEKSTIGVVFKPSTYSPPVINMQYYTIPRFEGLDEMAYSDRARYKRKYLKYPEYKITNLKNNSKILLSINPKYIVISETEEQLANADILELINKKYHLIRFFKNSKASSTPQFDFSTLDLGIKIFKRA